MGRDEVLLRRLERDEHWGGVAGMEGVDGRRERVHVHRLEGQYKKIIKSLKNAYFLLFEGKIGFMYFIANAPIF